MDIDVSSYLVEKCSYEEYIAESEYMPQGKYKEPEEIPCRFFGSTDLGGKDNSNQFFKMSVFVLDTRVKDKDRINGQIVKRVSTIYDIDGVYMYREAVLE